MEHSQTFMTTGELLKDHRESAGLTRQELADAVGSSVSMIKKYELDETRMPSDLVVAFSNLLRAPELRQQYAFELGLGVINVPVMTGVDNHLQAVLAKTEEELSEVLEDVHTAQSRLLNKRSAEDLNEEQRLANSHLAQELIDSVSVLIKLAHCLASQFDVDLDTESRVCTRKYVTRRYVIGSGARKGTVRCLKPLTGFTPSYSSVRS